MTELGPLTRLRTRRAGAGLILCGLLAGLAWLAAGCTSDGVNAVGVTRPDAHIDSLLIPLRVETLTAFGNLAVEDADRPLEENRLLYLGRQGDERSSILAEFDLAAFMDTTQFDLSDTNVTGVNILLYAVHYYRNVFKDPDGSVPAILYDVREVAGPLDFGAYPGPDPPAASGPLSVETEAEPVASPVIIRLDLDVVGDWLVDPVTRSIMISAVDVPGTSELLAGFAGNGFRYFDQIERERVSTKVGVVFQVEVEDGISTIIDGVSTELKAVTVLPTQDVSTFAALEPVPADAAGGFSLRTHLRSYPYFSFDLAALPPDAVINKALIGVTRDTTDSYGPTETIVVAELDSLFAPGGDRTVDLGELRSHVNGVSRRRALDPRGDPIYEAVDDTTTAITGYQVRIEFSVTTTVQRRINGLFEGAPIQFLLAGPEDMFPEFDEGTLDPDFHLVRFDFLGSDAPDPADRPYIKIVYSRVPELEGGGR